MTTHDDHPDFGRWRRTWQDGSAAPASASADRIRAYVTRRGRLMRAFMITDLAIGAVAAPVIGYLAWAADDAVERFSMLGLALITVAAVAFGRWNWSAVGQETAATTADFVALSVARLQRMRVAFKLGWAVLAAQVVTFAIWIGNGLYRGPGPIDAGAERFAWTWLAGFALVAALSLLWFGRWLSRDAARFAELRRELEGKGRD